MAEDGLTHWAHPYGAIRWSSCIRLRGGGCRGGERTDTGIEALSGPAPLLGEASTDREVRFTKTPIAPPFIDEKNGKRYGFVGIGIGRGGNNGREINRKSEVNRLGVSGPSH